jgi:hypothetical protein
MKLFDEKTKGRKSRDRASSICKIDVSGESKKNAVGAASVAINNMLWQILNFSNRNGSVLSTGNTQKIQ